MTIKMISACALNGAIGNKGKLLYDIPEDIEHFKNITLNQIVVMGRKTYESLPYNKLPYRKNVVLTTNKDYKPKNEDVVIVHDIERILDIYYNDPHNRDLVIIGGEYLYELFLPYVDVIDLTIIEDFPEEYDTSFPLDNIRPSNYFIEVNKRESSYGDLKYSFNEYVSIDHLVHIYQKNNPTEN